jgi:hypothetical protein
MTFLPKTRARTENLPACWGTHKEGNTVCDECVIEMCCEIARRMQE